MLVQVSGDRIAGVFEPDSAQHQGVVEVDVTPGATLFLERGNIALARNVGRRPFHEIVVELKDPADSGGAISPSPGRWCMNRQCGIGSLPIDLHPLPIEKESGRSSSAIRFRMLQAISASLLLEATLVSREADGAAGLTTDDPAYHAAPNRSRLVTSVIGLRRGFPSLLAG